MKVERDNAPKFEKLKKQIETAGHYYGSDAPILTITEFSDYQCPHCSVLHSQLRKLVGETHGLKVMHKDYPMDHQCNPALKKPFHTEACKTALFVRCAGEQGRYWEAADLVFENQKQLKDPEIYNTMILALTLESKALHHCMNEDAVIKEALMTDIKEALTHRFRGTPVIIFEGTEQLVSNWAGGRLGQVVRDYIRKKRYQSK
ncbi:MAG: DsbA family protein [Deltaproteobacteria bacterium]|nr:DsbA family protein [Deltaproteobacteria bacterium]